MNIFIGGAWPYANGSLHLGHIASLLPGDILARYYRQKGDNVLYVSGSDCNGTPITIRAKEEGVSVEEIATRYHEEFERCFALLGFSYDCYSRTDDIQHHEIVQEIVRTLHHNNHLYKKEIEQVYCDTCTQFLPDRYVEGICPHCRNKARGDQCDDCSAILDPVELIDKTCKLCGNTPTIQENEHLYFRLSTFQQELERYVQERKKIGAWRDNAIQLTERYVKEGLHDRAATRDLPVGVSVPVEGFEEKKVYVWIEAVAGYYSASKRWAERTGNDVIPFWNGAAKRYYVHGKDNIPFHTIIWPAILLGIEGEALPTHIVSNEYLTIEKKKLSTSRNWAVWVPDMVERYHPDSIRYFLTINAPEGRDTDFSWREFIYSHNSELLGAFGNFVNRTLKFMEKYYSNTIPQGKMDANLEQTIKNLYQETGQELERTHVKKALENIFTFIRQANKYFDERQPWKQIKDAKESCDNTIFTCVQIIANLSQLLAPFLPFSTAEIQHILRIENLVWRYIQIEEKQIPNITILFERIDIGKIEEERRRLEEK
ncbi:methionine--tRNA ligase [Priestia taiwanensis]|uniref:Methionine--tRNA ligase n=1 Tax=Priestia taiwanensis TaxID=1347902 RepID=A0A917EMD3_9BACI|nr:methionine--tRNA ligase [Priestia taiwanensis]MBM7362292.1 methionyl-tRNA synthetase [Priestia taiwanensis]GGE61016.1 methionine--tRNA ligase 1 [Priestia taiwanensis]